MASIKKVQSGWRARRRTPAAASRSKTIARRVEAEQFLTTVESSKLMGSYVDTVAGRVTLGEWWNRYEAQTMSAATDSDEDRPLKRATTAARDRAVMTKWWLPSIGRLPLSKL